MQLLTKKDILNARKGDPKIFLELVDKFIEENPTRFSVQDLTRVALGAAMSVVDRVPDPKGTRKLLGVVRDWALGRASDEDIIKAEKELWDLYYAAPVRDTRGKLDARAARAAAATGTTRRARAAPAGAAGANWAIDNALTAGACPQDIIDSIENEIGPLDWFLVSRSMK